MDIEKKVQQLIKRYGTANPFKIAKSKGIIIRFVPLGNVLGFYSKQFRIPIIHINESTSEEQRLFICGHELGHAILHPNDNTSFMKSFTYYSTEIIEQEANYFAVQLIAHTNRQITVQEAVVEYSVPRQFLVKNFVQQ